MIFRDFAETFLGSKVKIRLVKYFLSERALASERETASIIGVSHNAVSKTLKEFQELNFVTPSRIGAAIIWEVNTPSYAYKLLEDLFNKIKQPPIEQLKIDIATPFSSMGRGEIKRIVIFGSIADGRERPNSDIDVFVLVRDERAKRGAIRILSYLEELCMIKYGNKLSAQVKTATEFSGLQNKMFVENIKKGIIVMENENQKD